MADPGCVGSGVGDTRSTASGRRTSFLRHNELGIAFPAGNGAPALGRDASHGAFQRSGVEISGWVRLLYMLNGSLAPFLGPRLSCFGLRCLPLRWCSKRASVPPVGPRSILKTSGRRIRRRGDSAAMRTVRWTSQLVQEEGSFVREDDPKNDTESRHQERMAQLDAYYKFLRMPCLTFEFLSIPMRLAFPEFTAHSLFSLGADVAVDAFEAVCVGSRLYSEADLRSVFTEEEREDAGIALFPYTCGRLVPDVVAIVLLHTARAHVFYTGQIWLWAIVQPVRCIRLYDLYDYIGRVSTDLTTNVTYLAVFKFTIVVIGVPHALACLWWIVASQLEAEEVELDPTRSRISETSWVGQLFDLTGNERFDPNNSTALDQYWLSLYMALAGVAALGYVTVPANLVELLLMNFMCLLQIVFYAYVLGTLFHYLFRTDEALQNHRELLLALEVYVREHKLPPRTARKLRAYLDFQFQKTSSSAHSVFGKLPHTLKVKIASAQHRKHLESSWVLQRCSNQFISQLVISLQERHVMPLEILWKEGDGTRELLWCVYGSLYVRKGDHHIATLRSENGVGVTVGEITFVLGIVQSYTVSATGVGDVKLLALHRNVYDDILQSYPEQSEVVLGNILRKFELDKAGNDERSMPATSKREEAPPVDIRQSEVKEELDKLDDTEEDEFVALRETIRAAIVRRNGEALQQMTYAASEGDVERVRTLAHSGLDINAGDYDKRTTLHLAAANGNLRVVSLLCELGADATVQDRWGQNPLSDAIDGGHEAVALELRKHGSSLNAKHSAARLRAAASDGNVTLISTLLTHGVDINEGNYDSRTALHLAAAEGNLRVVEYMISRLADVNVKDRFRRTPVDDAITNGHVMTAHILYNAGSRPRLEGMAERLCDAASNGEVEALRLLAAVGVDVDAGDYDARTALHLAACAGSVSAVACLLSADADPNVTDRWGNPPLVDALQHSMEGAALIYSSGGRLPQRYDNDANLRIKLEKMLVLDVYALNRSLHRRGKRRKELQVESRAAQREMGLAFEGMLKDINTLVEQVSSLSKKLRANIDRWIGTYSTSAAPQRNSHDVDFDDEAGLDGDHDLTGFEDDLVEEHFPDGDISSAKQDCHADNSHDSHGTSPLSRKTSTSTNSWKDLAAKHTSTNSHVGTLSTPAAHTQRLRSVATGQGAGSNRGSAGSSFVRLFLKIPKASHGLSMLSSAYTDAFGKEVDSPAGHENALTMLLTKRLDFEEATATQVIDEVHKTLVTVLGDLAPVRQDLRSPVSAKHSGDREPRASEESRAKSRWHNVAKKQSAVEPDDAEQASCNCGSTTQQQSPKSSSSFKKSSMINIGGSFRLNSLFAPEHSKRATLAELGFQVLLLSPTFVTVVSARPLDSTSREYSYGRSHSGDEGATGTAQCTKPQCPSFGSDVSGTGTPAQSPLGSASLAGSVRSICRTSQPHDVLRQDSSPPFSGRTLCNGADIIRSVKCGDSGSRLQQAYGLDEVATYDRNHSSSVHIGNITQLATSSPGMCSDQGGSSHGMIQRGLLSRIYSRSSKDDSQANAPAATGPPKGDCTVKRSRLMKVSSSKCESHGVSCSPSKQLAVLLSRRCKPAPSPTHMSVVEAVKEKQKQDLKHIASAISFMLELFAALDVSATGKINVHDIHRLRGSMGDDLNMRDIRELLQYIGSAQLTVNGVDKPLLLNGRQRKLVSLHQFLVGACAWILASEGDDAPKGRHGAQLTMRQKILSTGLRLHRASNNSDRDSTNGGTGNDSPPLWLENTMDSHRCLLFADAVRGMWAEDRMQKLMPVNLTHAANTLSTILNSKRNSLVALKQVEPAGTVMSTGVKQDWHVTESDLSRWCKHVLALDLEEQDIKPVSWVHFEHALRSYGEQDDPESEHAPAEPSRATTSRWMAAARSAQHGDLSRLAHELFVTLPGGSAWKGKLSGGVESAESSGAIAKPWHVVLPTSKLASRAHTAFVVCMVWNCTMVPVKLAFYFESRKLSWLVTVDWVCDVMYFLKIIIAMNTAYVNKKSVTITEPRKIRKHYLSSEFWKDLLAVTPFDKFATFLGANDYAAECLRLTKLVRAADLAAAYDKWTRSSTGASLVVGLMQRVSVYLVVAHLCACAWNLVGYPVTATGAIAPEPDEATRWPTVYFGRVGSMNGPQAPGSDPDGQSLLVRQYLTALFFLQGFLTSVNLIQAPGNHIEVIYVVCMLMVNLTVFAWAVGEISTLVMKQDEVVVAKRSELERVHSYLESIRVPGELKEEISVFFHARLEDRSLSSVQESTIYESLPLSLQIEIARHTTRPLLDEVALLLGCPDNFLDRFASMLKERVLEVEAALYLTNDVAKELFFVSVGIVELVESMRHLQSARAAPASEAPETRVYVLAHDDYRTLLKSFPEAEEVVMNNTVILHDISGQYSARSSMSKLSKGTMGNRDRQAGTDILESSATISSTIALAIQHRNNSYTVRLCEACAKGDFPAIERLVSNSDFDINRGDYDSRRALHLAAAEGRDDVVKLLVALKGDVNVADRYGGTPLGDALRHGHVSTADVLFSHGAELHINDVAERLCHAACSPSGASTTIQNLLKYNCDPSSADYDSRTACHLAAAEGMLDNLNLLINSRADVNAQDRWGVTPLQEAFQNDHRTCSDVLFAAGGRFGTFDAAAAMCEAAAENDVERLKKLVHHHVAINEGDYDRRTGLHLAASNGRLEATAYLLAQQNIDPNPADRFGNTPLDDARRQGHEVVAMLLQTQGGVPGGPSRAMELTENVTDDEEERQETEVLRIEKQKAMAHRLRSVRSWLHCHAKDARKVRILSEQMLKLEHQQGSVISDVHTDFWGALHTYAAGHQARLVQYNNELQDLVQTWMQDLEMYAYVSLHDMEQNMQRLKVNELLQLQVGLSPIAEKLMDAQFDTDVRVNATLNKVVGAFASTTAEDLGGRDVS